MTINQPTRTLNTDLTPKELSDLNYKVEGYNKQLKEKNLGSKNMLEEADFMKLLVTQLKTQDPTKPMNDKEFIGQMAQFTSLKQMNKLTDNMFNLSKEFAFTKAVGLVNKVVTWMDENGNFYSGIVDSIKVRGGEATLNVEGSEVRMEQIQEVRTVAEQALPMAPASPAPKQEIKTVPEAETASSETPESASTRSIDAPVLN